MANKVIIGTQWGDEGKGKIVDLLSKEFDVVVRYQGGANAGHTVHVGDKQYIFHLLPSGVLHPGKICILGNGIVANPDNIIEEISELEKRGIKIEKFAISDRAHVTLDKHLKEDAQKGGKIGTTKRGIGPTYKDKIARTGIRFGDLLNPEKVKEFNIPEEKVKVWKEKLSQHIQDTSLLLYNLQKENKKILFEGAQGTHLDVDFGTYPFVTSSNTTAGGAGLTGIGPRAINDIIGIVKAYTTRVGEGPFPTELGRYSEAKDEKRLTKQEAADILDKVNKKETTDYETGKALRAEGAEYGATTGRPRRVGWLDLVAVNYSIRVNGITEIALTKLDILDKFDEIKVCISYNINGVETKNFPLHLDNIKPNYITLKGWKTSTAAAKSFEELPIEAQNYIKFIEQNTETPIKIISKGTERNQTITK